MQYWIKSIILGIFLFTPMHVAANPVGQVIGVSQGAFLERGAQRLMIAQGIAVNLDDVIATDAAGQVQLLFQDETRIVVGANSQLKIETILSDSSATASRFTVSAVEGAFRFLSGNSAKAAYSIRTPTGTMGIRGTEFDFNVTSRNAVNVVTFRGEVQLCNRSNQCALLRGGCAAVSLNSDGQFAVAESRAQKTALLAEGFPFVAQQNDLRRDFRTRTWTCGGQTTQTFGAQSPDAPAGPGPGAEGGDASPGPSGGGGAGAGAGSGASAGGAGAGAGSGAGAGGGGGAGAGGG